MHPRPIRHLLLWLICLLRLSLATPPVSRAADKSIEPHGTQFIQELQDAVGSPITVELKAGESFPRAKLLRVAFSREESTITSLSIEDPKTGKPRTIGFAAVRKIIFNGAKIYEAVLDQPKSAADKLGQKREEQETKERSEWLARAKANGVKPWPDLTRKQCDEATALQHQLIDATQRLFDGLTVHETQEFLFCSNLPEKYVTPYTDALDAMHDMMCRMYGIKPGEPVWKGKCLVVAFIKRDEFERFERDFMKHRGASKYQGLCHPQPDGRVVISCFTGDDPQSFANLLVHETSHGFIHRYRTPKALPSWVNEGMADSIARRLVPMCQDVQRSEGRAIKTLREKQSMGGDFLTREGNIESWQYGVASNLTDFLINADAKAYTRFVQGIKEGLTWEVSLKEAYDRTPEQMVTAYGESIGVPDLEP